MLLGVDIPGETWNMPSLPLSLGGLAFLAPIEVGAANGASWSDLLEMVENRHPDVAAVMVRSLHDQNVGHHLQGAVEADPGGHWFCRTLMGRFRDWSPPNNHVRHDSVSEHSNMANTSTGAFVSLSLTR